MAYAIRWEGDPEDVSIVFSGRVSVEELLSAFDALRAAPEYRKSLRILQDHSAVDWSQTTGDEIRRRAEEIVIYTQPDERHVVALVVEQELGFGLMRMREAHIDGRVATTDRVFYDSESAREWLRKH